MDPPEPSEPSLIASTNQDQHVHFSETAVEISGQMETNSVATNMKDRTVNPVDCESDGGKIHEMDATASQKRRHTSDNEDAATKASSVKKRAASSFHHDKNDPGQTAPDRDHENGVEVVDSGAKRAKRAKNKRPATIKSSMTIDKPEILESEKVRAPAKSSRPKRAKSASNVSLKEESDDDGDEPSQGIGKSAAKTEDHAEEEEGEEDSTSAKKKRQASQKKPNRVFSLAKAQKEDKTKSKSKKAAASEEEDDLEAMMTKYWERAKKTGKYVGAHISMAGGIENSITNAVHIGYTIQALISLMLLFFQLDNRLNSNPTQWYLLCSFSQKST